MSRNNLIRIQTTISGYAGKPVTLFSAYDKDTKILAVSKIASQLQKDRKTGCIVVTNLTDIPREVLFTEKNLKESIEAYYRFVNGQATDGKSSRLVFSTSCNSANPMTVVARDKIDTSGQKYLVSSDVTNAQIAGFATCFYADKASTIDDSVETMREITRMVFDTIITV